MTVLARALVCGQLLISATACSDRPADAPAADRPAAASGASASAPPAGSEPIQPSASSPDAGAGTGAGAAAATAAAPEPTTPAPSGSAPPSASAAAPSVASPAAAAPASTGAPRLGISGARFTIDGESKFLTLVSYFDALDATDDVLKADFAYFVQHGIDGVRVFPNWWDCADFKTCGKPSPRTLMDAAGALREGPLARLQRVLALAAEHRLIVDLSFARETVQEDGRRLDAQGYERGLLDIVRRLAGQAPHALIDLQNEIEINGLGTSRDIPAEVTRLRAKVRDADPARLVVASTGSIDLIKRFDAQLDAIAYHDPRHRDWWSRTAGEVAALRAISRRPIYFQEPIAYQIADARPGRDDVEVAHFFEARRAAREAGAAAWLFHTRKGFRLDDRSFEAQQEEGDRRFFAGLREQR